MDDWRIQDSTAAAVIRSTPKSSRIEMWTTSRLPFEPKGALLTARNHLRGQLAGLAANPQSILDARYQSTIRGYVDTENVLLYNVGSAAFAAASRFGLRFVREFSAPALTPDGDDFAWPHYHVYSLIPRQSLEHIASPTATWQFSLPNLYTSLKAHDYWWAAKEALMKEQREFEDLSGPYKMTVTIDGPSFRGNKSGT